MAEGYQALTEKEKETLRLILHGHDAKSMACQLDLSVHTINERLRGARRKLEVTSSKEAARLLLEEEGDPPNFLGHKVLGEAGNGADAPDEEAAKARIPLAWIIGGSLVMSMLIAAIALAALSPPAEPAAASLHPASAEPATAPAETDVIRAARSWLALVDAGNWNASWEATGSSFRELNTAETWARVSEDARPPMGAVLSRETVSQESVPAPPMGYEMVKFHTSFANKPDATEKLGMVKEDGTWKVVGYWIE